jgi:hypothetical protein
MNRNQSGRVKIRNEGDFDVAMQCIEVGVSQHAAGRAGLNLNAIPSVLPTIRT